MKIKLNKITDTTLFWIQVLISVIFGMLTYYIVLIMPSIDLTGSGLWGITGNFILFFGIYMLILIFLPVSFLLLKTDKIFLQSLKKLLSNIGGQLSIYFCLCTINYIINM